MTIECFKSLLFRANLEKGVEVGSSFAAFYEGEPVVDIWEGSPMWLPGDPGLRIPCLSSSPPQKESPLCWRRSLLTGKKEITACLSIYLSVRPSHCLSIFYRFGNVFPPCYRGWLDYSKPVSHYWPEFAQNGKDNITVALLLSHQVNHTRRNIALD